MNIFLHRDDLRIHDNKGLKKASEDGKTLPVYIEDQRVSNRAGKNKTAFRKKLLVKLNKKYWEKGSGLIYTEGKTAKRLKQISDKYNADKIYFNRSYAPVKRRIESRIRELNIESHSFKDRLLVEPKELSNEFNTFSPFYEEWKEKDKDSSFEKPRNLAETDRKELNAEIRCDIDLPKAGEESALQKWRKFRDNQLESYKDRRDDVGSPKSVSRLSMYYSSGVLGLRTVLDDIENLIEKTDDSDKIRNYAKYRNELAWREFFYQVLWHNPETVQENYRNFESEIQWRNDSKEFEAWKKGETGVPFVDAGIRELRKTGYMHNRTRQNVASFLTKHLMIDWRKGARFFRKHLVDHDIASNIGGWQWAASTGTDSVSIRIFNPVKQGRKYDTEAKYIKRHVPELRNLDANSIHEWVEMNQKDRNKYDIDYPDPIINFNQRYHTGKKMFENALSK